jgi:tetratricopeptide (TPR) repeat protein
VARARFWYQTGEGKERALETARRAASAAPYLAEARFAMALVHFYAGEFADAAREARQAVTLGPGLAEAHMLLGRLLAEVGLLEEGIRRLEFALGIDPAFVVALNDLSRCFVLQGQYERAAMLLAPGASQLDKRVLAFSRTRYLLWRRDVAGAVALRSELEAADLLDFSSHRGAPSALAAPILELIADPSRAPEVMALVKAWGQPHLEDRSLRKRTFGTQIFAELYCFIGDPENALGAIETAVSGGLVDLAWTDHCPILGLLRADPRFAPLREVVAARAAAVIAAYREQAQGQVHA